MASLRVPILAIAAGSLLLASTADAQIGGGIRVPETQLDGVMQAHTFGCFLASAGRPVPGINLDAPDLMGEGLHSQTSAEPWLVEAVEIETGSTLATLDTPEGPVWIVFDGKTRACTVALQRSDVEAFRSQFVEKAFDDDWDRKKDKTAAGFRYEMKLAGLKFVSAFPDVPAGSQVFVVDMRTN